MEDFKIMSDVDKPQQVSKNKWALKKLHLMWIVIITYRVKKTYYTKCVNSYIYHMQKLHNFIIIFTWHFKAEFPKFYFYGFKQWSPNHLIAYKLTN